MAYGDLEILRLRAKSYVSMVSYGHHYCDQSSEFDILLCLNDDDPYDRLQDHVWTTTDLQYFSR